MCTHLEQLDADNIIYKSSFIRFECEECIKIKSEWVHLRICQGCGRMLCCDSSKNQHASKHAVESGHPVISSAEMGENWFFCYIDQELAESLGG